MSDDLISRKELIKRMELAKIGAKSIVEQFFFDGVMAIIDTQETAFDTEKVIEELKEEGCIVDDDAGNRAVEIIEKGGIK